MTPLTAERFTHLPQHPTTHAQADAAQALAALIALLADLMLEGQRARKADRA
jgi:hypothetical protein